VLLVVSTAASDVDELAGRLWGSGLVTAVVEQASPPSRVELRVGLIDDATTADVDALVAALAPRWEARPVDDTRERSAVVDAVRSAALAVRVGSHLVVAPPWVDVEARPGDAVITIEPGLAFGTGSHPTTAMALAVLEQVVLRGASVLDVGCGTGVLAVAAVRLGAARVVAVDTDPAAIAATTANVERNQVTDEVEVVAGDLGDLGAVAAAPRFDVIVANLSAGIVASLAPAVTERLAPAGLAVLTGILDEQADEVIERLKTVGLTTTDRRSIGGWTLVEAARTA
jgi:ribosomal protein L11 methyltransferase